MEKARGLNSHREEARQAMGNPETKERRGQGAREASWQTVTEKKGEARGQRRPRGKLGQRKSKTRGGPRIKTKARQWGKKGPVGNLDRGEARSGGRKRGDARAGKARG